ncbi:MAG: hypothetical protein BWX80_02646 [Candidatus Hydrogenedentes bacterium ADurb.Bin101]|nr:MAG: hypothetical protein BWX80_02646 [Candidatus Hydrogenedentes bacterium ADurb.Bin101]
MHYSAPRRNIQAIHRNQLYSWHATFRPVHFGTQPCQRATQGLNIFNRGQFDNVANLEYRHLLTGANARLLTYLLRNYNLKLWRHRNVFHTIYLSISLS